MRTTVDLVKALLTSGNDFDPSRAASDLVPFIDSATLVVADLADCAVGKGESLSDARLEIVERWLSAHYYMMTDRGYSSNRTGNASATYQGKTEKGLEASFYGQTALTLDPSGCLTSVASGSTSPKTISLDWLGLRPSEQTPYRDRD